MHPKTLVLMLVAVACGLIAAFLAANYAAVPTLQEQVPVLVSNQDGVSLWKLRDESTGNWIYFTTPDGKVLNKNGK